MPWNKTVLSALLTGIILSAALAGKATARFPSARGPPRSRNNETPAARTLLGGRGRFQISDTAASNDYTAGAPGSLRRYARTHRSRYSRSDNRSSRFISESGRRSKA